MAVKKTNGSRSSGSLIPGKVVEDKRKMTTLKNGSRVPTSYNVVKDESGKPVKLKIMQD